MTLAPQLLTGLFTLAGAAVGGVGASVTARVTADRQDRRERWKVMRDEKRDIVFRLIHTVDSAYELAQEVWWPDGITHTEMPADVSNKLLQATHAVRTCVTELVIADASAQLVKAAETLMKSVHTCHEAALPLATRDTVPDPEAQWQHYRDKLFAISSSRDAYQEAARSELLAS